MLPESCNLNDYSTFRANVPHRRICVDNDGKRDWGLYDMGNKTVKCPLICLPPVSGRADVFYKQLMDLSVIGYRIISVDYPTYWSCEEFCLGLKLLFDHMQLDKVHLLGASLGAFLAQKFTEQHTERVLSLILCNGFTDTSVFKSPISPSLFWMMPYPVLQNMLINNINVENSDPFISGSIKFFIKSLDSLDQKEIASRLTLNCKPSKVNTALTNKIPSLIIDVNDTSALSETVKEDMLKCYSHARRGHMKSGGNFPYLSRAEEFNLFLKIHLKQFQDTAFTAILTEENKAKRYAVTGC